MKFPPLPCLSSPSSATSASPSTHETPAKPAKATPASAPGPQPFDELRLSEAQLLDKTAKLKRKGYFTIPMGTPTKRFLKAQHLRDAQPIHRGYAISFKNSPYEDKTTAAANRIASTLLQQETRLEPMELEVRWPDDTGADQWHQDRLPKVLVCLTTLEGSGTEFVTPEVVKEKFYLAEECPADWQPKGGEAAIAPHVRHAKKDKFYFFAGLETKEESIPKLLHRAPHETDRSIFMIRWKRQKRNLAPKPEGSNDTLSFPRLRADDDSDGDAPGVPAAGASTRKIIAKG